VHLFLTNIRYIFPNRNCRCLNSWYNEQEEENKIEGMQLSVCMHACHGQEHTYSSTSSAKTKIRQIYKKYQQQERLTAADELGGT